MAIDDGADAHAGQLGAVVASSHVPMAGLAHAMAIRADAKLGWVLVVQVLAVRAHGGDRAPVRGLVRIVPRFQLVDSGHARVVVGLEGLLQRGAGRGAVAAPRARTGCCLETLEVSPEALWVLLVLVIGKVKHSCKKLTCTK